MDGVINKFGILNQSLSDIINAGKNNGFKGIVNLFSQVITDQDIQNIKEYNRLVGEEGINSQSAWYQTMLSSSDAAKELFESESNLIPVENGAILSEEALTQATIQRTTATKAATVATKALVIAGNMIAMWAVTKVLQVVTEKINEFANASEIAAEKAEGFTNSVRNSISNLSSNISTLSNLNEEYKRLSEGVNALGENISLSSDDYDRYKQVIGQVSNIMPNLATYFNSQGEAIAFTKGNLGDLNKEYEKYIQTQAKAYLVNGDEDGNKIQDVLDNYANNSRLGFWESVKNTIKNMFGLYDVDDMPVDTMTKTFEDIQNKSREEIVAYLNDVDLGANGEYLSTDNNRSKAIAQSILGCSTQDIINSTDEEFNEIQTNIANQIEKLQADLDIDMSRIHTILLNSVYAKDAFWDIDDTDIRDDITTFMSSINSDIWDRLNIETEQDFQLFASKIINGFAENKDGLADAWNGLFSPELLELPINDYEAKIQEFINVIADYLNLDENGKKEFLISLGIETDSVDKLKNSIRQISNINGTVSFVKYRDEYFKLTEYTKDFTIEQEKLWLQTTLGAENAEDAIKKYEEALRSVSGDTNETSDFSTQLTNSKDSLDKFQSSVKSAADAYATLLSGNYSSSELLDSIQTINQAVTDMGESLDWEGIGSLDELQDKLEDVSRSYAESILSGTGIDVESDLGKMLTGIIQQMYEVEAKFTGMNTQLDNLQSSYQTLTGILESYNETGFINLDTLQSLLTADENLISMLEVENGQLVLNQEAYEELVAVQLLEFKEKLDNAAAAEIEALALSKAEEATNNNAQASEDAVTKLDAETEAFKRNTEAASENAITKAIANAEDAGVSEEEIQNILNKYDEVWNAAINNYHKDFPTFMLGRDKSGSGSGSASSSTSSAEKDFEETFDWIETAIDRIERSISNLNLKASSVYRSWSERNSNLKTELIDVRKEMDIQASGYNKYMQQAASVGLSEEWASKVRNGQIDINSITDNGLAEQIKQYQAYYEKALKCQDAVENLRESVSKLYETAFDNIVSQFDSIVSVIENSKSMLDEQIDQAEERGYIANVSYYEALIKVEQKNIEQLTKERASLQSALADAVSNGAVAEGSQEWADMQSQIDDVTLSIEQANTAMIKYGNSIRDIQWQIFDLIQDRISRISSESDFLINLLSYDKQYDDRGQLTDTGMSTVGLHGMNYNVYMAQADKYAEEMLRIDKELAEDPYNQDLAKRRQELLELQQEMIIAAEDEKQAVIDMVEEGINLELDALKGLIDTYTDALDAQKDLYDYQKNIAKQTEEIASLQKQLSAYEGDLSEEARQKVQQIKVSLENAKEQLEETEYERYISDQKKLLDDLYLEYETTLNQRLDNIDALIADMIASSNANAGMISDTLSSKADSVGYYLSESMEDIWNTNTGSMLDALAMYDSNVMGGFARVNTSVGEVIRGVTETVSGIGNVNTTINNAIGSIIGNMQAILDKLSAVSTMQSASAASSYYGGSGGMSSSGGSSGAASGSGSGFFIDKKDSYPKGSLNINTSIIDRLKYYDFDSSFSARQMYYSKMGLPGTYTGTDAQNAKMLEWMKLNGYKNGVFALKKDEWAWTQEGGKPEVILNPDGSITRPDGSVLTPLRQGDSVLNADATKNLFNFANHPQSFIREQMQNLSVPQNTRQDTISNDIQLTIELPNVQNYEQFRYALQHDKQFEKVVQAMTTGRAVCGNSFKKYNV